MTFAIALGVLLAVVQPIAPLPYPPAPPPPFDAPTRPKPLSPVNQIAPHGDPRDSGWIPLGEPGSEAQVTHLPDSAAREATCRRRRAPVCGADERTYPTACEALRAGVEVRRAGMCRKR